MARPVTKMRTIASSSDPRRTGESLSCALAAHTNADHAHHTSASTSIERPNPAQVSECASSAVTCVTAKTKTRSQRSSTGLVRRSISRRSIAEVSAQAPVGAGSGGDGILALARLNRWAPAGYPNGGVWRAA